MKIRSIPVSSMLIAAFVVLLALCPRAAAKAEASPKPIPVIYDSDIGDDIDDTWALGLLLKCPELDVKLVVGDRGKAEYRARLFAKFLQAAGRTDIPIGLGLPLLPGASGWQKEWIDGYDLDDYPGKVHKDGVQAIIDTIMQSPEPVTLIAVGPLPNIAAALEREPRIAQRARFVGMHGSVRRGHGGREEISAEHNVRIDPQACQKVFSSPWKEITITPLDTCGLVNLKDDRYRRVRDSRDPIARAVIENYKVWNVHRVASGRADMLAQDSSSTLFDTVAVYLAFRQNLCRIENLGIRVTDDGYTHIDDQANRMDVATDWKDLDAFRDFLVTRLTSGRPAE